MLWPDKASAWPDSSLKERAKTNNSDEGSQSHVVLSPPTHLLDGTIESREFPGQDESETSKA
ncbi:hypothetical protein CQ020_06390 [Arthrobacter sp. MYb23]|nr:hypothetical protein CQ038_09015 [Arthrobacter sp. MYb51]PRB98067.1 hypothetical protein CQ020_06390 [Arthrobacter sp. MYb23]